MTGRIDKRGFLLIGKRAFADFIFFDAWDFLSTGSSETHPGAYWLVLE